MWRKAAAVSLVTAPILLAVATAVDPALGDDQGYGIYRQHPEATQLHSLLLHWAWVLFVPGLLGLLAPIRRRGAVLARVTWCAVLLGLATFSALMAFDFFLLALEQTLPDAQVAAVDTHFQELLPTVAGWQWPGLLGWALSLLLAPIAAARARVIDWWTAGAALAGMVLYLAFAISPVPVNLLGPVVLIGAYASAAWQLLRPRPAAAEPDTFGAFRRRTGSLCCYAAPVVLGAGVVSAPDGSFVAHPLQTQISALMLHFGWLLFVPAVLFVAARGRRFTQAAAGVTVLALLNFSALMVGDSADLAARQVLDDATADRVGEALGGPFFTFGWVLPGMVLSLLGLMAVAVGAAVDRLTRWWVAVLVVAGVAAFLVVPVGVVGLAGPVLLLAGFGLLDRDLRRPAEAEDVPAPVVPAAA